MASTAALENPIRVLVVDDDKATVELVRLYLERDHYEVHVAHNGKTALELAATIKPDLVILDWMLPGLDGLTVCEQLRSESEVPVIMLTARVSEADKLLGLTSGADDYLTKPFSPRELTVRVGIIIRRVRGAQAFNNGTLEAGPVRVDTLQHEVWVEGREVSLTPTEFNLLTALAREPKRAFSREQLIEKAMEHDPDVLPRTIDVHINNLRRKLRQEEGPEIIGTVHGIGYRLEI